MSEDLNDKLLEKLEKTIGGKCPPELKKNLVKRLNEVRKYTPKVGVLGKSGVGKSSLCNALFGENECKVSDIAACTREPQEVLLEIGSSGLKLIDVPGVGENDARDKEYHDLYKSLLPELDLIFWIFKGDDRAFTTDQNFYKNLVRPYVDAGKPFIAVINQVDKIEPFREWNEEERKPGAKQASNIEAKRALIAGLFDIPMNKVLAISANERYGLMELVDSIVHELPGDKKFVVLEKIKAADDAAIAAAQAKAAEAQANLALEKAKAETTRLEIEKAKEESARKAELAKIAFEKEQQAIKAKAEQAQIALELAAKEAEAKLQAEARELERMKIAMEQQRIEIEKLKIKADQDRAAKEAEDRARKEKELFILEQHRLEMEKLKLKAEQDKAVRDAEERERHAREMAEERSRNRNVSSNAEKEAEDGVWETVVIPVAKKVWGWIKDKFF